MKEDLKIFNQDLKLEELEQNNKWQEAVNYLYQSWINDKFCINNVIRISSECWYILVEWEHSDMQQFGINYDNLRAILVEVLFFCKANFKNEPIINFVLGYMLSLFPEYFFSEEESNYDNLEKQGKNMLKKAKEIEPNNPVFERGYFNSIFNSTSLIENEEYNLTCQKARQNINQYFVGNSCMEVYFRDIFSSQRIK